MHLCRRAVVLFQCVGFAGVLHAEHNAVHCAGRCAPQESPTGNRVRHCLVGMQCNGVCGNLMDDGLAALQEELFRVLLVVTQNGSHGSLSAQCNGYLCSRGCGRGVAQGRFWQWCSSLRCASCCKHSAYCESLATDQQHPG
ncbi:hypothetical protein COO60DRAFT_1518378 [Scenedesmus sp. NREL 46B-D3]|nr:hypothetical protein COO60DRAFT_1518378 [Scenedesmus sp. NREL 46B-D3]